MVLFRILQMSIAALALIMFSGCASFNRVELHHARTTTIGQELTDLKKAKDQGLLSEEEYLKTRKDIFDSATFGTNERQLAEEGHSNGKK